jgi:hypothetical protein
MRCSKSIYSSPRGNPKELVWNLPAERFRRLEIVDQLELSQLNYREASRPLAFENPASTHGAGREFNFSFPTGGLSYRA